MPDPIDDSVDYLLSKTNENGVIVDVNKKFCDVTKYSYGELIGKTHSILSSGHHSNDFFTNLWETLKQGKMWIGFIKNKAKDGTDYWVKSIMIPVQDDGGNLTRFICLSTVLNLPTGNYSDFKNMASMQRALDETSIVAITDNKGNIIHANKKFLDISKYSQEELLGQNHRILKSGYHDDEFYKNMWNTISSGKIWNGVIKNKAKDGSFTGSEQP